MFTAKTGIWKWVQRYFSRIHLFQRGRVHHTGWFQRKPARHSICHELCAVFLQMDNVIPYPGWFWPRPVQSCQILDVLGNSLQITSCCSGNRGIIAYTLTEKNQTRPCRCPRCRWLNCAYFPFFWTVHSINTGQFRNAFGDFKVKSAIPGFQNHIAISLSGCFTAPTSSVRRKATWT